MLPQLVLADLLILHYHSISENAPADFRHKQTHRHGALRLYLNTFCGLRNPFGGGDNTSTILR
jgi:hypothetical protein